jgi:UDP-2,3-diacylglucosamine hydrolase
MTLPDPRTVFVSDIHLSPGQTERLGRFQGFLSAVRSRIDRLYILGDLFDYWVGPSHLQLDDYRHALGILRRFSSGGPKVFFVPGNRDYLVGPEFERAAGLKLLPERDEVSLGGRRVLFAHGDFLYNRNPRYTAYRRIGGARGIRRVIASMPTALSLHLAARFREVSRRDTPKAPFRSRADLLAPAMKLFGKGIDVVVCGHLHREEHLQAPVDGRVCDLFLLGEWSAGCPHLLYERGRFEMKRTV